MKRKYIKSGKYSKVRVKEPDKGEGKALYIEVRGKLIPVKDIAQIRDGMVFLKAKPRPFDKKVYKELQKGKDK